MFAAVDLGSNSFRLHIGTFDGERIRIVNSAREPVMLGAGLDRRGNLTPQAIDTALACLQRFARILKATPLAGVRVVATNTVRIARNASSFLPLAEKAIGHPIEVISGEEEGRLIYMGVACALDQPNERRLVIDIGGGSTELILGHGSAIEEVESFTIGTAATAASFFGGERITAAAFDDAILAARSRFEDGMSPFHPKLWEVAYGSSGSMRTLAEVIEKNALGDGQLSIKGLTALKERLIDTGRKSRIDLIGVRPERISVILGGLPVLLGLALEGGLRTVRPIEAGLRMGVLWDLHMRERKRDRRQASVRHFMQRFGVDVSRASQAAANAVTLYRQLCGDAGPQERLLGWAGQLHEVGMMVSHTGFHKHGAYLALNADLPGFTTHEQDLLSVLLLAQKGNLRKVAHVLSDTDILKAILALRLGILFMHARIDPAVEPVRLQLRSRIELSVGAQTLASHPTLAYWIAKEQTAWEEADRQFILRSAS